MASLKACAVASALAAAVGLGLGLASCSAPAACSEDTCNGCCTAAGRCVGGEARSQCGRLGLACADCGSDSCTENRCVADPPPLPDAGARDAGAACTPGFKGVVGAALVGTPLADVGAKNLALADLDGDGRLDAALAFSGTGQGYLLRGNGDGTFAPWLTVPGLARPVGVEIARLDRDARPDVVFAGQGGPSSVLLAQADGGWAKAEVATHAGAQGVSVGDVDGDTFADLVVPVPTVTAAGVWVNLGVGDGTFGAAQALGDAAPVLFTGTADLDGDGRLDFASVRADAAQLSVVLRDATGAFAPARSYGTGAGPRALALGLIDADNRPDVVVVNATAASLTLRPNDGDGTFPVAATRATTRGPATVAIGDVTGDALPDVVVGGDKLDIFPGLGGGNLGIPTVFPTPASSVAIADVDGDGTRDVVVLGPSRLTTYLRGCW